jgi:hypothetical protein
LQVQDVKDKAKAALQSALQASFATFPDFLLSFVQQYPGSQCVLVVKDSRGKQHQLEYQSTGVVGDVSLSNCDFVACVVVPMWSKWMASVAPEVFTLDACHLQNSGHAKYSGVLISFLCRVIGRNVLLGFGLVPAEDEPSYTLVLTTASKIIPLKSINKAVVLSDRHQAIKAAMGRVLPGTKHFYCILHIFRNILTEFGQGKNELRKLVMK